MMKMNLKSLLINALAAFSLAFVANTANAQTGQVNYKESAVSIRHLGNDDGNMYFRIQHPNVNGNKVSIVVKDNKGNIYFDRVYSRKSINLKLVLPKFSEDVYFQVKDLHTGKIESFSVNTKVKVIEEVVISKL